MPCSFVYLLNDCGPCQVLSFIYLIIALQFHKITCSPHCQDETAGGCPNKNTKVAAYGMTHLLEFTSVFFFSILGMGSWPSELGKLAHKN